MNPAAPVTNIFIINLSKIYELLQSNPPPDSSHFLGGFGVTAQVPEGGADEHKENGQETAGQGGHDGDLCFLRLQIGLFTNPSAETACKDD